LKAATDGAARFRRRNSNINIAFTYGRKLIYKELDDAKYKEKVLNRLQNN
jgi:hypothetical protein